MLDVINYNVFNALILVFRIFTHKRRIIEILVDGEVRVLIYF